jgi:ABC-type dipeptide/oligopeptide/nickel transport system ATPase component
VIAEVADRIAVMRHGRIVETGPTQEVFAHPKDEYTQALLRAHPHPDPRQRFAAG